jgi:hypothetical protein
MKTTSIILTILCGFAMGTLVFGVLNDWHIPLTTFFSWAGSCILCPIMVGLAR